MCVCVSMHHLFSNTLPSFGALLGCASKKHMGTWPKLGTTQHKGGGVLAASPLDTISRAPRGHWLQGSEPPGASSARAQRDLLPLVQPPPFPSLRLLVPYCLRGTYLFVKMK